MFERIKIRNRFVESFPGDHSNTVRSRITLAPYPVAQPFLVVVKKHDNYLEKLT